jgi:hypothetical protein
MTSHQIYAAQPASGLPALYLHDLTGTSDADRLLNFSRAPNHGAALTLNRLKGLDPVAASQFTLKQPKVSHLPFKLVSTAPIWKAEQCSSYIAISYCWHSNEWDIAKSLHSRKAGLRSSFPISLKVLCGILQLRNSQNEAFWIDQLCICQDNPTEKARAIDFMDTIYQSARLVAVVLEDMRLSRLVEAALKRLVQGTRLSKSSSHLHLKAEEVRAQADLLTIDQAWEIRQFADHDIFDARWFTRVWCAQEYRLNANRVFVIPGWYFSCLMIDSNAMDELLKAAPKPDKGGRLHYHNASRTSQLERLFQKAGFGTSSVSKEASLSPMDVLCNIDSLRCSILADKISVALNILDVGLSFSGSILDQTQCRYVLTLLALSLGDLYPLLYMGYRKVLLRGNSKTPLSWIWWPSGGSFIAHHQVPLEESTKNLQITVDSITMDMLLLPEPKMPTEKSVRAATQLLSKLNATRSQIQFLACVLDHGLVRFLTGFVANSPEFKGYVENNTHESLGETLFASVKQWISAESLEESSFQGDGAKESRITMDILGPLVFHLHFLLLHLKTYLLGHSYYAILNPSHDDGHSEFQTVQTGFGEGEVSILCRCRHWEKDFSTPENGSLHFAISPMLTNPRFERHKRVWVLQKKENLWSVVSKAHLLNVGALHPNVEGIELLKNALITGPFNRQVKERGWGKKLAGRRRRRRTWLEMLED